MSIPTAEEFLNMNPKKNNDITAYGTVVEVQGKTARIKFDDEEKASSKFFKCLYTPNVTDDVFMIKSRGSYVIINKIAR